MYRAHRRRPANGERESPSIWDSSEAWAACAKALREYDEDMIQDWKEEIDTLLVFVRMPRLHCGAHQRVLTCQSNLTRLVCSPPWSRHSI